MKLPNTMKSTVTYAGGRVEEHWTTYCGEAANLGALKQFYIGCARNKVGTWVEESVAMNARFREVTGRTGSQYRAMNKRCPGVYNAKC